MQKNGSVQYQIDRMLSNSTGSTASKLGHSYVMFEKINRRYFPRLYFVTLTEYVMKGLTHNYKN